jgi:hypothetical protein
VVDVTGLVGRCRDCSCGRSQRCGSDVLQRRTDSLHAGAAVGGDRSRTHGGAGP